MKRSLLLALIIGVQLAWSQAPQPAQVGNYRNPLDGTTYLVQSRDFRLEITYLLHRPAYQLIDQTTSRPQIMSLSVGSRHMRESFKNLPSTLGKSSERRNGSGLMNLSIRGFVRQQDFVDPALFLPDLDS